jgi:hypothetical protein
MPERRVARPRASRRTEPADRTGVVKLRLSGDPADICALLDLLTAAGVELAGTSRPYPNTRSTGVRVYTHAAADTADQDQRDERQ